MYLFPNGQATERVVRPRAMALAADGSAGLQDLTWDVWDSQHAHATGTEWSSDCTPTCASGTVHRAPVTITLSRPLEACGLEVFSSIRYVFPDGAARPMEPDEYTQTFATTAQSGDFAIVCG
ncbi:MAG TPA: hypothetical protein VMI11_11230 [Actinomycetes bacterium]|nr:hypothetical protein [Actinomycetes bacterium]